MLQKSFVSFVKWAPRKPERIAKTQNLQRVLTKLLRKLGENSAQKALRRDGAQMGGTRRREGFVVNASDAAKYCWILLVALHVATQGQDSTGEINFVLLYFRKLRFAAEPEKRLRSKVLQPYSSGGTHITCEKPPST
jgi:hypothetical protein